MTKIKKRKDAKEPFTFEIRQEDVDKAEQCDAENCVFAQAIARVPSVSFVEVRNSVANVLYRDGTVLRYAVPTKGARAIKLFDGAAKDNAGKAFLKEVPLGKYQFSPPTKKNRLAVIRKEAKARRANNTHESNATSARANRATHPISLRNRFARAMSEKTKEMLARNRELEANLKKAFK